MQTRLIVSLHRIAIAIQIRRICATAGLVVLAASLGCPAGFAAEPKRVMLLHSFGQDFKPWSDYSKAIRLELRQRSPWPLDIIEFSLVTARFNDENPEQPFVEYLSALSAKHPFDLIVSIGAPAAGFVQRHRQQLFTTTPMMLMAVEQRRVQYDSLTANDAVVPVRINYLAALENILQILPETKNVVVVTGASPLEKFWKETIRKEAEPLANRIKLSWTDELSFEELLKQARALPPHTAIFWELMLVDAAGVVHEGDAPLTRLHAVASAPIFSYDESFFGNGVVGGQFHLVADTCRQAAAVAIRILGGEPPSEIRTTPVQFASPVFDWREMQRWGISESRLPEGATIRFRPLSFWDQYNQYAIGAIAVMALQLLMIGGLIVQRTRRQRAEAQLRKSESEKRNAELRHREELAHVARVRMMGEFTVSVTHELKQPLGAILNNAGAAELFLSADPLPFDEIRKALSDICNDTLRSTEIIHKMRRLLEKHEIVRKPIDVNYVVDEIVLLMSAQAAARKVGIFFEPEANLPQVHGDRVHLQQVVMNLVLNGFEAMASVSESARRLRIQTGTNHNGTVIISVSDSGQGIPEDRMTKLFEPFYTTKNEGLGMGLSISRTIVEAHEGRLWAENNPDAGATFHIELPAAHE